MASHNQSEVRRLRELLIAERDVYLNDEVLDIITNVVIENAAETMYNAGMSGMHDDNGARLQVLSLRDFLQGVRFGRTNDTELLGGYTHLYEAARRQHDPEYKEYLRLKEKFGDD